MDLIKIGKFISECRKKKNLTQEQLAEKLYITDRAVSKWERGLSLPDADKMLDLCNILDISINELFNGEKINMKDEKKKTEELLLSMAKQEEINNKKLYTNMYVSYIVYILFYLGIMMLASMTLEEGPILGIVIVLSTLLLCIAMFYNFKIEVDIGYYECMKCHHKFHSNYFIALLAPHIITTRYLKCPKCNKWSWARKVLSKEK